MTTGTVVVTGGARGIGRAIASRLVNGGYDVVIADVADSVGAAATQLGGRGVPADITSSEGVSAIVDAVTGGDLVGLVNNAGITRDAFVTKMTEEQFSAVLRVNLFAAYDLTRALVPLMARGGSIVSMASRAYLGNIGQFNYSMSKGGLVGMTRALAQDFAPDLRFNAVAPGLIATDMTLEMPQKVLDKMVAKVPLRRMGEPAEVAALVAFLLSPASSYITGHVHVPCGGRSFAR